LASWEWSYPCPIDKSRNPILKTKYKAEQEKEIKINKSLKVTPRALLYEKQKEEK
jgi:hypothetical protein